MNTILYVVIGVRVRPWYINEINTNNYKQNIKFKFNFLETS